MSNNFKGLNGLIGKLDQIQSKADELSKPRNKELTNILTPNFMKANTPFNSLSELFSAGGFEVNSKEDYAAIPDEAIDKHVKATTNFSTWHEMLEEATKQYFASQFKL